MKEDRKPHFEPFEQSRGQAVIAPDEQRAAAFKAPQRIVSSAPGRICLFGEHQDYLRLPVIPMAVDLRITLNGCRRDDGLFCLNLPEVGIKRVFDSGKKLAYEDDRDFLAAAVNVVRREGAVWTHGYNITVSSRIPINSGASSSSALQVAWVAFLLAAAGDPRHANAEFVAMLAHRSEVVEFDAPGGMMDQYSSALGGLIFIDCREPVSVRRLPTLDSTFVLIDSGTPKQTSLTLSRVRRPTEEGLAGIGILPDQYYEYAQRTLPEDVPTISPAGHEAVVRAAIRNFHLTQQAKELLEITPHDCVQIGTLLDSHHEQLSRNLRISTDCIDGLLNRANELGALGGKINGSGGGGTCFALCPNDPERVAEEIAAEGYKTYVVRSGPGVEVAVE